MSYEPSPSAAALMQSLSKKPTLSREEIQAVLRCVPLLVVADDDPSVRRTVVRTVGLFLRPEGEIENLEDGVDSCFDRLPELRPNRLPVIHCANSLQARDAIENIRRRLIEQAVLFFDNDMGQPKGLELFQEYDSGLATATRIIQTGRPSNELIQAKNHGTLDGLIIKPDTQIPDHIARAFLNRNYGGNAK